MKIPTFDSGAWGSTEVADPSNGTTWEATVKSLGFDWTGDCMTGLGIHVAESEDSPWAYLVDLTTHAYDRSPTVLVRDLGSLLLLAKLYEPLWRMSRREYVWEDRLEPLMKKAFEAWHGHPLDEICEECDRYGWNAREKKIWEERTRKQEAARLAQDKQEKGEAAP